MNNAQNQFKDMIFSLVAEMPTPEEADEMGIYDDVVVDGVVYSYKGEELGTVEEMADKEWFDKHLQMVIDGKISEDAFEHMCELRG